MMKCWEAAPDNRPTFKELHKDISKYAECIAGYLDVEFNPFGALEGIKAKENEPKDGLQLEVSIQVIPPSVDTTMAHSALTSSTD